VVDIHLVEDALGLLAEPGLELGAQQVDPAVQDAPPLRDLLLFLRQLVDVVLEVGVGERCEIGKRFHVSLSSLGGPHAVKQKVPEGSTLA